MNKYLLFLKDCLCFYCALSQFIAFRVLGHKQSNTLELCEFIYHLNIKQIFTIKNKMITIAGNSSQWKTVVDGKVIEQFMDGLSLLMTSSRQLEIEVIIQAMKSNRIAKRQVTEMTILITEDKAW